jgi:predicted SnoaL-like aldol condensation-catalyzing enzyme
MAAGIPTSNILQPGAISVSGGVTRALISDLQLLTPQFYNKYVQKYGNEEFFMWLATYGGMEEVRNRNFFWFENRGKLMVAVTNLSAVNAPAVGGTVTVDIPAADLYNSSTQSPLRIGETVRIASNNVEGEILTVPSVSQCTIRPKKSSVAFASPSGNLDAGEILIFGGQTDVGEASGAREPLIHLDVKYENNITEIREDWSATDLAEMTEVYYNSGVSGSEMAGGAQAGTSYFTYKGLVKSNTRYKNNIEAKLMRGDEVTNTGLLSSTSVGSEGFIPKITADGETVNYTPGTLDIAKLHEITRIMDVNGCTKENLWLSDIFQRQDFSDGIFQEFPAGAWVWGKNENSEEAAINYGVQSIKIDGYLFKVKKYTQFNTEVTTGKTPVTDYFRNYGIICPQGSVRDARDASKSYKNITVMYQQPQKGGTTGNGIRVWQWGGGSMNASDGTLRDHVSMITYRGTRICAANQFVIVAA